MNRLNEIFGVIFSVLRAWLRLCFLTATLFISGTQLILFSRMEICNVEMKGMPWMHDRQKDMQNIAFLDRLCVENPELLDIPEGELPEDFPHPDDDEESF